MSEPSSPDFSKYLTTRDLAKYTGISASTWNKKRLTGDGPAFVKIGRTVVYPITAVDTWLAARVRRSTSDQGVAT